MHFLYARRFEKQLKRLPRELQERAVERRALFAQDRRHPLLDDHALHEPWLGCRSFSITGDVRTIYRLVGENTCLLLAIGTHHELYGT
ncbi:MAG TPA: type II toxin-antitoxin system YafQ family toxin [Candidatus Paceibacterota bacterium]